MAFCIFLLKSEIRYSKRHFFIQAFQMYLYFTCKLFITFWGDTRAFFAFSTARGFRLSELTALQHNINKIRLYPLYRCFLEPELLNHENSVSYTSACFAVSIRLNEKETVSFSNIIKVFFTDLGIPNVFTPSLFF